MNVFAAGFDVFLKTSLCLRVFMDELGPGYSIQHRLAIGCCFL
jgi:hypothetical protein